MLGKKRLELRSTASKLNTTLIVGKGGISEGIYNQALSIINKHEILKGKVLKASMLDVGEAARDISGNIGAEIICNIGNKFILYKKREKKPINKPKNKTNTRPKRRRSLSLGKKPYKKRGSLKLKMQTNAKGKFNKLNQGIGRTNKQK